LRADRAVGRLLVIDLGLAEILVRIVARVRASTAVLPPRRGGHLTALASDLIGDGRFDDARRGLHVFA
jgi:hypothetical protein